VAHFVTVPGAFFAKRCSLRFCQVFFTNLPTFTYSLSDVQISGIATDSAGNTYLTGSTLGTIPTTPGAFQTQFTAAGICGFFMSFPAFCHDSFVVKLDPTGAVVFATYLGGNGDTIANAIAVDGQGNVYVAGTTAPPEGRTNTFPVTPGAAYTDPGNAITGFVAKLNPSGSQLVYATFIPTANVSALAVNPGGERVHHGTWISRFISGNGRCFSGLAERQRQSFRRNCGQTECIRIGAGLRYLSFRKRW
jgi:hypothetical protein